MHGYRMQETMVGTFMRLCTSQLDQSSNNNKKVISKINGQFTYIWKCLVSFQVTKQNIILESQNHYLSTSPLKYDIFYLYMCSSKLQCTKIKQFYFSRVVVASTEITQNFNLHILGLIAFRRDYQYHYYLSSFINHQFSALPDDDGLIS